MSRSGYSEDCDDHWSLIRWRGAVNSAIKGRRGQALLKELIQALDSMPEKWLVGDSLVTPEGDYCTLGVLGAARGIALAEIDPDDSDQVAQAFNIAPALAREIVFENDEGFNEYQWVDVEVCGPIDCRWSQEHIKSIRVQKPEVGKLRWEHMRKWAEENINKDKS